MDATRVDEMYQLVKRLASKVFALEAFHQIEFLTVLSLQKTDVIISVNYNDYIKVNVKYKK